MMTLAAIDWTRTSMDFFLAGQKIPAWVCGLAFLSANLGAQGGFLLLFGVAFAIAGRRGHS